MKISKKIILVIILFLTALLFTNNSKVNAAVSFTYTVDDDNNATITGYSTTGSETEIEIPSDIKGHTVIAIGDSAFSNKRSLTKVTIPNTVTSIGDSAFKSCSGLTGELIIPDSVTSIGDAAFRYCSGLTEFVVSNNNKNYATDNGVLFNKEKTIIIQFPGDKRVNNYVIPDSVTIIGDFAFSDCSGLTGELTIPDSVVELGIGAFSDCTNLSEITIPDSVIELGDGTFYGCTNLSEITISDSVVELGSAAFSGCTNLSEITIPDSVVKLGSGAFSGCTNLSEITIPDSVVELGSGAFSGCTNLKSAVVGNGITDILSPTFGGCSSLTDVVIGNNVKNIGSSAFVSANNVKKLVIGDSVTEFSWMGYNWKLTNLDIGNNVTNLEKINPTIISQLKEISVGKKFNDIETLLDISTLDHIYVSENNPYYTYIDGVVYTKDKTEILFVSRNKFMRYYFIPKEVKRIRDGAFSDRDNVNIIFDIYGRNFTRENFEGYIGDIYTTNMNYLQNKEKNDFYSVHNYSLRLTQSSYLFKTLESEPIKIELAFPYNLIAEIIECNTENSDIAYCNKSNYLVAVSEGTTKVNVKVRYVDGTEKTLTSSVTVKSSDSVIKAQSITLDKTKYSFESIDSEPLKLIAAVSPENVTNNNIIWESSDDTVATVSINGEVTPIGNGRCVITAITSDGTELITKCNIVVGESDLKQEIVNESIKLKMSSNRVSVKSGEIHEITIKTSNSSPNVEKTVNCKIYLEDDEKNPNEKVTIIGLENNKKVFNSNDPNKQIEVELKEEKDESGNLISRYLEYSIEAGASFEMELMFSVPSGTSDKEEILKLVPEVKYSGKEISNSKIDEELMVKWVSKFNWKNLKSYLSSDEVTLNVENKFTKKIDISYTVENLRKVTGVIWANCVKVKTIVNLPDMISLPENITYSGANILADDNILYSITLPEKYDGFYIVNDIKAENKQLYIELLIYNPNVVEDEITDEFNVINEMNSTLYAENLVIDSSYISEGKDKIETKIEAEFYPCVENVDSIKLDSSKDLLISEDVEEIVFIKTVDKTNITSGTYLTYNFKITNNGKKDVTKKFKDSFPREIDVGPARSQLVSQGFEVYGRTVSKEITVKAGETYDFSVYCYYSSSQLPTDGRIINTASYGELTSTSFVNVYDYAEGYNKKITKRWAYHRLTGYNENYLITEKDSKDSNSSKIKQYGNFNLLAPGDRIEYELTIENHSTSEKELSLYDSFPEVFSSDGNLGSGGGLLGVFSNIYFMGLEYRNVDIGFDYKGASYYTDFVDNMLGYSYSNPAYISMRIKVPANTTYKQTVVIDIPTYSQYDDFLDNIRNRSGQHPIAGYFVSEENRKYNVPSYASAISSPYSSLSLVEHSVLNRAFIQTGVLARNKISDFIDGVATIDNSFSTNGNVNLNQYDLSSDEVVTFYTYFINDSIYDLNLSDTNIYTIFPKGFEFLGFNTLTESSDINSPLLSNYSSDDENSHYFSNTSVNNYSSDNFLFVADLRNGNNYNGIKPNFSDNGGLYNTPDAHMTNSHSYYTTNRLQYNSSNSAIKEYEKKNITVNATIDESTNIKTGITSNFSAKGVLKSGEGFYLVYSCLVHPDLVVRDNEQANTINTIWDFPQQLKRNSEDNYYYNNFSTIVPSNSFEVFLSSFGQTSKNEDYANDGFCSIGRNTLNYQFANLDDVSLISTKGSNNFIWSGVDLTPVYVSGGAGGLNINCYINKLDENSEKLVFDHTKVKFQVLDENNNILNFTKTDTYYSYSKIAKENTVTEIESNRAELFVRGMPEGKFYLKEIEAPRNFELSTELIEFELTADDRCDFLSQGKEIQVSNSYKTGEEGKVEGTITIEKVDSTSKEIITTDEVEISVDNQKFVDLNVKDEKGAHYRFATDSDTDTLDYAKSYNGKIIIENVELEKEYVLNEQTAPWGYSKSTKTYKVLLSKTSETINKVVQIENTKLKLASVNISKLDYEESIIENGIAKFEVYDSSGNLVTFKRLDNLENSSEYIQSNPKDTENTVNYLETYKGKIHIQSIMAGNYTLKEIEAPSGYIKTEVDVSMKLSSSQEYNFDVKNANSKRNINILKKDNSGNLINSDIVTFKLYNENEEEFKLAKQEDGIYYVSSNVDENTTSTVVAKEGKIVIKDLPLGKYFVEEIIPPNGYVKLKEKVSINVLPGSYADYIDVSIKNPNYEFGTEEHVSISYQKIQEVSNNLNYGFGYYDKADYKDGNYNYIVVDKESDKVTYNLKVSNMSNKAFEKLVLINKLPYVGDNGVVNLEQNRESQFEVKLLQNSNFKVTLYDENDNAIEVNSDDYTIEYSDKLEYTNADFDGDASDLWYDEVTDTTKSFRIVFGEDFVLPAKYNVNVEFTGKISDEAQEGQIAWNSFAYRYYVGNTALTPEPPKVGVKLREYLDYEITKIWNDDNNRDLIRPESVTIQLLANEEKYGEDIVLSNQNSWKVPIRLPKYDSLENEIKYTLNEILVPEGYTTSYDQDNLTVTNTHEPEKTSVTIKKIWDDKDNALNKRPDKITVQLYANGEIFGDEIQILENETWTYTVGNLNKNENGKEIIYTVKETSTIDGYEATYSDDTFTITNTYVFEEPEESVTTETTGVMTGDNTLRVAVSIILVVVIANIACFVILKITKRKV